MSVDVMRKWNLSDLLNKRIDFTPAGQLRPQDLPAHQNWKVLESDKIHYGDKSTTGSPISSFGRSSSGKQDESSSSASDASSPLSITQDLIGVDSPGLCGPATPLSEQLSPLPAPKYPGSTTDEKLDNGREPVRKSRFDQPPSSPLKLNGHAEKKEAVDDGHVASLRPNGAAKRKVESSSSDEDEDDGVDPRSLGMGSFLKRIKLETVSTTVVRPPSAQDLERERVASLVPRSVARRPSTPPVDGLLIGPTKPQSNGLTSPVRKGLVTVHIDTPRPPGHLIGPSLPSSKTGASTSTASTPKEGRKRLLSERGEKELSYPVLEKQLGSKFSWKGADWLGTQPRGAGLINRSNDCFLNAVLQMVTHTAPLARYIVENHVGNCKREHDRCVACPLKHYIIRCFKAQGPLETRWIRPHLSRFFPSHMFGMQEDAHELLTLLLDAIDHPVGSATKDAPKELPPAKLKPSTPIEQIFGGTLRNQVTCQSCHTPHINYERIREFNLALIKREDQRVPISQLVNNYFKNEELGSSFACKKCARKTEAVRVTRILRAPAVLIVQLKRFNAYGNKLRQAVQPDRDLDLSKYTFQGAQSEEAPRDSSQYVLTGIVEHLGSTVDHGHYVAYVRGVDGRAWWKFDDEEISKLNPMSVQNNANPYLLIYTRKEDADSAAAPPSTPSPIVKNGHLNGVFRNSVGVSPTMAVNRNVYASPKDGFQKATSMKYNNGYNNGYGGGKMNNGYNGGYNNVNRFTGRPPFTRHPYKFQPKRF